MSKESLQLPKTAFSMKANLPKKEPDIIKYWEKINLYKKLREKSKGKEKFVLHDGPPYANGHIHMGTALNKILKEKYSQDTKNWIKESKCKCTFECAVSASIAWSPKKIPKILTGALKNI